MIAGPRPARTQMIQRTTECEPRRETAELPRGGLARTGCARRPLHSAGWLWYSPACRFEPPVRVLPPARRGEETMRHVRDLSRREFLVRAGGTAAAIPTMSAILDACSKPGASTS